MTYLKIVTGFQLRNILVFLDFHQLFGFNVVCSRTNFGYFKQFFKDRCSGKFSSLINTVAIYSIKI